jgi:hypothetical protein
VRKPIAAILAGLLSCASMAASEPVELLPASSAPEKTPAQPVALQVLRETIRIAPRDEQVQPAAPYFRQTDTQPWPSENTRWMERHPVWFGLLVGAGAGAALGAASCGDGCFPIGAGGAAIVGSWYGAGAGALIGWGISRAR